MNHTERQNSESDDNREASLLEELEGFRSRLDTNYVILVMIWSVVAIDIAITYVRSDKLPNWLQVELETGKFIACAYLLQWFSRRLRVKLSCSMAPRIGKFMRSNYGLLPWWAWLIAGINSVLNQMSFCAHLTQIVLLIVAPIVALQQLQLDDYNWLATIYVWLTCVFQLLAGTSTLQAELKARGVIQRLRELD